MINKPLLLKTMEKIEELDSLNNFYDFYSKYNLTGYDGPLVEVWGQGDWINDLRMNGHSCGTSACFAGWAVLLDGSATILDGEVPFVRTPTGDREFIGSYAREILGLDEETASTLFKGNNTKQDLRRIVNKLLESEE